MYTISYAPGAAKFLLSWPATDVDITKRSGESFLANVRMAVEEFSDQHSLPNSPDPVQHQFMNQLLIRQWPDIEVMLVER
jgi:hypothetical protein